jgi:Glyoxalase-like domain
MARLKDIVFDCRHAASLARFWAELLDGYVVAPYDESELERLRQAGIDDPEDDPTVLVESSAASPRLWFQAVPEEKVAKNRVHLDIVSDSRAAEVDRLLALGASVSADHRDDGWLTLQDPERKEFCLFEADGSS